MISACMSGTHENTESLRKDTDLGTESTLGERSLSEEGLKLGWGRLAQGKVSVVRGYSKVPFPW